MNGSSDAGIGFNVPRVDKNVFKDNHVGLPENFGIAGLIEEVARMHTPNASYSIINE